MMTLQLTPLAKARVWLQSAIPAFVSAGTISKQTDKNRTRTIKGDHVTLEALVPRGARAEYGLLGISFNRDRTGVLQVEVPCSEGEGAIWLDSVGKQVDDVRLGLPHEYAVPALDAAIEFGARRFPAGTLKVIEAAHGLVGSNEALFRRLAVGALTLMLDERQHEEGHMATMLKRLLVDGR